MKSNYSIDPEEYIKRVLQDKKNYLEKLQVNHQIEIAKYEALREQLKKDIDGLERQLSSND